MRFCRVAVDSPVFALDRPFDYAIPERMAGRVAVGSVVRVVLHGRRMRAFVTELVDEPAVASPRPLSALVSPRPLLSPEMVELARWAARRYVVPLATVLHEAVPGRFSLPEDQQGPSTARPVGRTEAPGWIPAGLGGAIETGGEVWLAPPGPRPEVEGIAHAVSLASDLGRRTLVVCPRVEVAERVAECVGDAALIHGDERPSERAKAWAAAMDGKVRAVVGGRSALFVPVPELGLVVVASAHERSLKSERTPRLHALPVAAERARMAGAALVISSPAPPVDLFGEGGLPRSGASRVSVRPEVVRPRGTPVTPRLLEVVSWALERGSNALVFAGRKGKALRLRCRDCGWGPDCPSCGSGMVPTENGGDRAHGDRPRPGTLHSRAHYSPQAPLGRLACRVCGRVATVPEECGSCGGRLDARGWGHQRLVDALRREGVGPVVGMVRGEIPSERPQPAVVVGTIAAAHAVGSAGCVCVADLDQLLARPDFRASEYALQTLYELAGVLSDGGRFLVQAREPENHVVQAFTRGSFEYFLKRELEFRKETSYPPYGVVVRVEGPPAALDELASGLGRRARTLVAPAPRGKATALVRARELDVVLGALHDLARSGARAKIDVDPVDVL